MPDIEAMICKFLDPFLFREAEKPIYQGLAWCTRQQAYFSQKWHQFSHEFHHTTTLWPKASSHLIKHGVFIRNPVNDIVRIEEVDGMGIYGL